MEQMIIENQYQVTKKKYIDWARVSLKKRSSQGRWLWVGATALALAVAAYGWFSKDIIHASLYIVIALFCVYRGFLRMDLLIAKQFEVLRALQGAKSWTRTLRFEGSLLVEDGRQSAKYSYHDMVRLAETEKDYWIYFKDGISICLDKKGFTQGSAEDFLEFMAKRQMTLLQPAQ